MKLSEEYIKKIEEHINEGLINKEKHPYYNLYILNYSKTCQLKKIWNEYTCLCRGLIVDDEYNIIARPFVKFFNDFEIEDKNTIPNLPFEVFEKIDGSLGILYFIGGHPHMATRGSFVSDQSNEGEKILYEKYGDIIDDLDTTKTYLFEIVYPENHIIINYGDMRDIILLAVIDTETGRDENLEEYRNIGFNVVKRYDGFTDYSKITSMMSSDNKEGFVIKFTNGFRMKIKFEEYFRLHSLFYGLSFKKILDMLADGQDNEVINIQKELDEENSKLIQSWIDICDNKYDEIAENLNNYYRDDFDSDKEAAEYFLKNKYSGALFAIRKNKNVAPIIWNYVKKELKN